MKKEYYQAMLESRLKRNFDLFPAENIFGMDLDLYGKYRERVSKFMMSKKQEVYAYQSHNHLMYRHFGNALTSEDLGAWKAWIERHVDELVHVDSEHMSSVITVIWSSDTSLDPALVQGIQRFRYYKSFLFGFKGWVNVKLVHIDLSTGNVVTNRLGRDLTKLAELPDMDPQNVA